MENYAPRPSVSRLGSEVCAVINRVRRSFGSIPMRGPAALPQVRQAEQVVDQTARQLLRGDADLSTWYRALRQYEDCWMLALEQLRSERKKRHAA
ncbi:MAG: hypothetical protein ACI906_001023 [Candidatus Latescibacterota bacterium]|jgi:hypothetical protein